MDWNKEIYEILCQIEEALRQEFAQRKLAAEAARGSEEWLTPNDVQALLQISERTYRRRLQAGVLTGEMVGGSRYFRRSEMDRLLSGHHRKWKR